MPKKTRIETDKNSNTSTEATMQQKPQVPDNLPKVESTKSSKPELTESDIKANTVSIGADDDKEKHFGPYGGRCRS